MVPCETRMAARLLVSAKFHATKTFESNKNCTNMTEHVSLVLTRFSDDFDECLNDVLTHLSIVAVLKKYINV